MGVSPREFSLRRPKLKSILTLPLLPYLPFLHWFRKPWVKKALLLLMLFALLLAGMECLMQKALYTIPEAGLAEKATRLAPEVAARCGPLEEVHLEKRGCRVSVRGEEYRGTYSFYALGAHGEARVLVRWKSLGHGRNFETTGIVVEPHLRGLGLQHHALMFVAWVLLSAVTGYAIRKKQDASHSPACHSR